MIRAALACVLAWACACSTRATYTCTASDECVQHGIQGACTESFCAFPDMTCASGLRYEANAGDGLAGQCATGLPVDGAIATEPIAFVQGFANKFGTATVGQLAFAQPLAAHHAAIIGVDSNSPGTATVTDSQGNTFTPVLGPITNGGLRMTIFAAFDVAGGADTLTVTLSAAPSSFFEVYLHEYAGIVAYDTGAVAVGSSTATDAMASGPADTHAAKELVFGYGVTGSAVAGTGFTERSSFDSNITEDQIVTMQGTYDATATMTAGSGWTMLMATFR